ncbi:MAG: cyclase [Alphaproteobacteria bacterium]|nr:cyclase [Alphaproteobacteria bacterium]
MGGGRHGSQTDGTTRPRSADRADNSLLGGPDKHWAGNLGTGVQGVKAALPPRSTQLQGWLTLSAGSLVLNRCDTCQHQNADDANFCVNCGTTLAQTCPKCARRNAAIANFCAGCGLKLHGDGPPVRVAHQPPAQDSASLLSTRSAREGERKRVTMLFADIAGSTGLIEKLDPEDAANLLGSVTSAMREAVARFEGTVNKMQGDGIMALFGAPIPQEDHATRACCAALAMIESVRAIEGAPAIRVGIHTGEVVVRAITLDMSVQYDAMGVAVHLAARLEQQAEPFAVAISKATLRAAAGSIVVEMLGERQLKGISEPVPVYALKGIRSTGTSQQFQGGQRLSAFVGRDLEMTVLRRALDAANAGNSRVLGIVGEAGSGKSRMVFEFLETCRNEGRPVLEARATAHGRVAPLQTVLNLMRAFFGIDEDMTVADATSRVRAAMARADASRDTALLLDFLSLPLDAGEAIPTDIAGRRAFLLDAVKHLARSTALANPSVLVIEDLHWLDPASEPFIEAVAQAVAGTNTLLLVDFRPGYRATWMERSFYEQVSLVPLSAGAVAVMLDRLLGKDPALSALGGRIVDRAAGNPFFAEELVRALIERGALTGMPGAYRPTPGAQDVPLPETVQSVLGSRIDRLAEGDKLLLQAAAVIGREFPLEAAAEIAELAEDTARASLARLLAAEMLYERPDLQRDAFAFRHPLVQEAAYGSLLSERRHDLHRRAATALSAHHKDRADETASLIAHHWEEAGDAMQAAASYVKAALWIGTRDPRQALEAWRKVRRLLESAPPAPPVDYMMMMACGQIVNYAWREGIDAEEIEPVFEQAMALARKLKDMRAAALITMAFGRVLAATGSANDYVAKVEEAQKLVKAQGLASVEAVLAAVYSHALSTAGRFSEALSANEVALDCVAKIGECSHQDSRSHYIAWLRYGSGSNVSPSSGSVCLTSGCIDLFEVTVIL